MNAFKLAGFDESLDISGISPYTEILDSLGISVSRLNLSLVSEVGASNVLSFDITFADATAKTYYLDVEAVIACSSLFVSVVHVGLVTTVTLTYSPTEVQDAVGTLWLNLNSRRLPCFGIPLTINSFGYGVLACDEVFNFPTTEIGFATENTFTLMNSSTTCELSIIDYILSSTIGFDYSISREQFPIKLLPQQSIELAILFIPTDNSTRTSTLKFKRSDGLVIPNVEVALLGAGILEGVTKTTPLVVFNDIAAALPVIGTGVMGVGILYQVYENNGTLPFLVVSHTFTSSDSTLMYPELIDGVVLSVGEKITIPISFNKVSLSEVPRLELFGYYL